MRQHRPTRDAVLDERVQRPGRRRSTSDAHKYFDAVARSLSQTTTTAKESAARRLDVNPLEKLPVIKNKHNQKKQKLIITIDTLCHLYHFYFRFISIDRTV